MHGDAPLIVGAGPVGLAAAVFLAAGGVRARVIEKRAAPSLLSKALAINPRTLEILAEFGIAERLLAEGRKIVGAKFGTDPGRAATVPFSSLKHRYPFMLALSQAATERILESELERLGVRVERSTELMRCGPSEAGARAFVRAGSGPEVRLDCPWILAADGAHSTARASLGIAFSGDTMPEQWHLADAALDTGLADDHAHAFILARGEFLFMIPVIDHTLAAHGPVWRMFSNRQKPLERLAPTLGRPTADPIWESAFTISHRVADRFQRAPVFLAGDAAHIHSPAGARGMNLGIEDARVFAGMVLRGSADRYDVRRRHVDAAVVRRVRLLTRTVSGHGPLAPFRGLLPALARLAPIRHAMVATLTGTDHPLDRG
ncbi:MAG: FAD-dependent monooxygenase [Phycisphaerales bacterium]